MAQRHPRIKSGTKLIDSLRKATALDHKYAPNLAAVYQQRAYAAATNQQFQDAINDYGEAIKISPEDSRIYEQRAAVEMKLNDMDKALADYSEAIKLSRTKFGITVIAVTFTRLRAISKIRWLTPRKC